MKVSQLIEELQKHPTDMPVVVRNDYGQMPNESDGYYGVRFCNEITSQDEDTDKSEQVLLLDWTGE